jgi:prenylcysteine alpha-carboxyl methylesterase
VESQANSDDDDDDDEQASAELLGKPVVVFYTGGAWIIGYKMWGALLARALTAAGILVVIPDYRNYPLVSVPDMVSDIEHSLQWVRQNITTYGGDPEKIVVVGQSAGGHLSCTMLLKKALENQPDDRATPPPTTTTAPTVVVVPDDQNQTISPAATPPDDENPMDEAMPAPISPHDDDETGIMPTGIQGYIALSAPFCLQGMQDSFTKHGLDDHLIDRIFGGERDSYSPKRLVEHCREQGQSLAGMLPPIRIYHGTRDKTVPHNDSQVFTRLLAQQHVHADAAVFTSYEGWSHTDAILEGPMDNDHRSHKDIFLAVQEWTDSPNLVWPQDDFVISKRLCPHFLIGVGRFCNPF